MGMAVPPGNASSISVLAIQSRMANGWVTTARYTPASLPAALLLLIEPPRLRPARVRRAEQERRTATRHRHLPAARSQVSAPPARPRRSSFRCREVDPGSLRNILRCAALVRLDLSRGDFDSDVLQIESRGRGVRLIYTGDLPKDEAISHHGCGRGRRVGDAIESGGHASRGWPLNIRQRRIVERAAPFSS